MATLVYTTTGRVINVGIYMRTNICVRAILRNLSIRNLDPFYKLHNMLLSSTSVALWWIFYL